MTQAGDSQVSGEGEPDKGLLKHGEGLGVQTSCWVPCSLCLEQVVPIPLPGNILELVSAIDLGMVLIRQPPQECFGSF